MLSLHPATEVFQNGGSLKIAEGLLGVLTAFNLARHCQGQPSDLNALPRPPQKSRK